jgi:cytochrome c oxidase subunit 1
MLTAWYVLARRGLGDRIVDPEIFRLATALIAVFAIPALIFMFAFEPFGAKQIDAFRRLQFVLAFPALLVAVGGAVAVARARKVRPLPWRDPAFFALALSALLFASGGVMGLLITGSDTRTPAHYHGMIAAATTACMGLTLTYCLPALLRPVLNSARLNIQIALFAVGQLTATVGMFLAGGYGAPRKTPSGLVSIPDGAVIGMYLHGIGALFAVTGGAMFVAIVLRALLFPRSETGERQAAARLSSKLEGIAAQ